MKSHADASAELAKDDPEFARIYSRYQRSEIDRYDQHYLLALAATEHAQRKQLESRVEKLRSSQTCLFSNDGCRKREPRPLYWCRCCMTLAADDALAKEQPKC